MEFDFYIPDPSLIETYIKDLSEYALQARLGGILALEGIHRSDLLGFGLELMSDGHEPEFVNHVLQTTADNAIKQMDIALKAITLAFDHLQQEKPDDNAYNILLNCLQPYENNAESEERANDLIQIMKSNNHYTEIPPLFIKYIKSLHNLKALSLPANEFNQTASVLQQSLIERLRLTYVTIIQGLSAINNGENPRVLEKKLQIMALLSDMESNLPPQKKNISQLSEAPTTDKTTNPEIGCDPNSLALGIISLWFSKLINNEIRIDFEPDNNASIDFFQEIEDAIIRLPKPVANILTSESFDFPIQQTCLILESTTSGEWYMFSDNNYNHKTKNLGTTEDPNSLPRYLIDKIKNYAISVVGWLGKQDSIMELKYGQTSWPNIKSEVISLASSQFYRKNSQALQKQIIFENPLRSFYYFNDIVFFENRGIQALIRHLQHDVLLIALANANTEVRNVFFGNMSHRAKELLCEDLADSSAISEKESSLAQKKIMQVINQFLESGDIQLSSLIQNMDETMDPWQQALEEQEDKNDV